MRPLKPIDPASGNFQGLMLAAHPGLHDPNFRRSVLLLTMHTPEDGAFGFVLNQPLGKTAADLLPQHEQSSLLARVPVYLGGPVGRDQLGFAGLDWDDKGKLLRLDTHLSLEDVSERLAQKKGAERVCAFVGYSGWSAGQLEEELAQKAWVLVKPQRTAADRSSLTRLWFRLMGALGPSYKLLSAVPDDVSLN